MLKVLQIMLHVLCFSMNHLANGNDLITCERDYVKIGCYEEKKAQLSDLLIYDRNKIKWNTIQAYMHHLACKCSQAAKNANDQRSKDDAYVGFALHYYGECYGRTKAHLETLKKKGQSHRCIGDQTYTKCDDKHQECIGKELAEYIYKFRSYTIAVDGGYSNWEPWSGCEGACGIGIKRRERTCTKPEPKGNGKDCSYFGNSTEQAPCETGKKCPELLSKELNKTACEGEDIYIECRGDATIKIISTIFGRVSLEVCKRWYQKNWSTTCRAKKALAIVKQACEWRSSCFLYANTGVFGDPCFGTEKYLKVTYKCKSRVRGLW